MSCRNRTPFSKKYLTPPRSGPQAATLMHQYMDALPPLRPLTFVLKYFMASRDLNQPYTGGVGSFMLQMMIVSFLQHRERDAFNNRRPSLYNLGALLVEFFELYSCDFNFITTVSCTYGAVSETMLISFTPNQTVMRFRDCRFALMVSTFQKAPRRGRKVSNNIALLLHCDATLTGC